MHGRKQTGIEGEVVLEVACTVWELAHIPETQQLVLYAGVHPMMSPQTVRRISILE